jgi:hypothetical protein
MVPHSNHKVPAQQPERGFFFLAADLSVVPAEQPKVALQLPFRG